MSKSLKKIISENQTGFEMEDYNTDLHIVLDFFRDNFNFQMIDYVLLLCKDNAAKLERQNRTLQEHQGWNATTYSSMIIKKLESDIENYGEIQQKNWPYLTTMCMMYMDSGVKFEDTNLLFKTIVVREKEKIADEKIKNWVDGNEFK